MREYLLAALSPESSKFLQTLLDEHDASKVVPIDAAPRDPEPGTTAA